MTEEVPPLEDAQERKKRDFLLGILVAAAGTSSGFVLFWAAPWLYQDARIMVAAGIFILTFFPVLYLIRRDPELRLALPIPVLFGVYIIVGVVGGVPGDLYFDAKVAAMVSIMSVIAVYTFWIMWRYSRGILGSH